MKKLLLLLIVISFSLKTKAQIVFCPPGAEWHYLFTEYWPKMGTVNCAIKYVGDSIEGNDTLKILNHTMFFLESGGGAFLSHIKQKGDTVFMRNGATGNQWQVLYNFSAQPGQSWTNSFNPFSINSINYTISVVSVQTKLFANKTIKELTVNYTNSYGPSYSSYGTISEYYGFSGYLFNYIRRVTKGHGSYLMDFLCYSDSIIGEYRFSDKACEYSSPTAINEFDVADVGVKIYPNPFADFLTVNVEDVPDQMELSIVDLQGRRVRGIELQQKNKIDLRDLSSGLYFIIVTKNKEIICKEKLIKE